MFQAHAAILYSVDDVQYVIDCLRRQERILRATCISSAYRYRGAGARVMQGHDDDTSPSTGRKLIIVMELAHVINMILVVSQWIGDRRIRPLRRERNISKVAFGIINHLESRGLTSMTRTSTFGNSRMLYHKRVSGKSRSQSLANALLSISRNSKSKQEKSSSQSTRSPYPTSRRQSHLDRKNTSSAPQMQVARKPSAAKRRALEILRIGERPRVNLVELERKAKPLPRKRKAAQSLDSVIQSLERNTKMFSPSFPSMSATRTHTSSSKILNQSSLMSTSSTAIFTSSKASHQKLKNNLDMNSKGIPAIPLHKASNSWPAATVSAPRLSEKLKDSKYLTVGKRPTSTFSKKIPDAKELSEVRTVSETFSLGEKGGEDTDSESKNADPTKSSSEKIDLTLLEEDSRNLKHPIHRALSQAAKKRVMKCFPQLRDRNKSLFRSIAKVVTRKAMKKYGKQYGKNEAFLDEFLHTKKSWLKSAVKKEHDSQLTKLSKQQRRR